MTNPGTALTHNLEYITDNVDHKLYMYCDMGNPGDVFDDIKVAIDPNRIHIFDKETEKAIVN